jgi:hypothetical protein
VSEQQAEQNHSESGSVAAEPAVQASSEASAPVAEAVSESSTVEVPAIAPDHETLPKDEAPAVQASAPEVVKAEPILDQAAVEKAKESLLSGRLLIMSPGVRAWQKEAEEAKAEPVVGAPVKQRRFAGMAAILALATLAGAVSGALATIGVSHFVMTADAANTAGSNQVLEESVSRIDADITAIKAGLDHAAKTAQGQLSKTNDRLDKIEKAQAEPTSKIAKMSEALDKLRAAQAAVPASAVGSTSVAAKDIREKDATRELKDTREKDTREATGSVTQATTNVASASPMASVPLPTPAPPKTEVARLPKVEGWVLRDVNRGGALIEGRQGLYEVYAGDPVPGLGKVDAIRKQDGRWVVVTTKGLVMAR